jgi:tRNA dimethylallyltransferase
LAVQGPTASGKTRLAVALAQELEGELVNADSRQAIAELSVGVCKPTPTELQGVVCHGLDWSHLGRPFSAAQYRTLATRAIEEVAARGHSAIVVGGTGLYVRALLGGYDFGHVPPEEARTESADPAGDQLMAVATQDLARLDPERAQQVDLGNPRRVIRAAELARAGTRPHQLPPGWSIRKLGCRVSPKELRARIEARSDRLLGQPLRDEADALVAKGFSAELLARSAIGYSEVVDWALGRCPRQQALERVVARTWRYAKAQMTWLRGEPDLVWVDATTSLDEMVSQGLAVLRIGLGARFR